MSLDSNHVTVQAVFGAGVSNASVQTSQPIDDLHKIHPLGDGYRPTSPVGVVQGDDPNAPDPRSPSSYVDPLGVNLV